MPTPTDLVTDLPADFEVFGQAVDTQMKTNADAATQKATLTTKGDIYAATGTSTPARLAVGTNNQVLTVDSTTATGLKWAAVASGGMTELASGSLTGSTVTLSSISQSYNHLQLTLRNVSGSSNTNVGLRINSVTSGYNNTGTYETTGFGEVFGSMNGSRIDLTEDALAQMGSAYNDNSWIVNLYDYSTTNTKKGNYIGFFNTAADNEHVAAASFVSGDSSAAITSLSILAITGSFDNGTYVLWGVK